MTRRRSLDDIALPEKDTRPAAAPAASTASEERTVALTVKLPASQHRRLKIRAMDSPEGTIQALAAKFILEGLDR